MKRIFFTIFIYLFFHSSVLAKPNTESFADIVEPLLSSVVSIASTTIVEERKQDLPEFPEGSPFDEFFKEYFDQYQKDAPTKRPLVGLGSGFIIDSKGIAVTNNHVIDGADEITIIMEDGKEFIGSVIGKDPKGDLAVIEFDPKDTKLKSVEWGDSDKARVGDWAIAIGNPLGLGGSVTTGIVSAIARDIGGGPYVKFIQTDASINRGNSGGPLFNIEGKVIGINSAIISQTGGSIGLGFAIPSNSAKKIVSQLIEFGHTKRGWLGVQIQGVTEEIAESLGLDSKNGAFIANVQENSPAKKAGIEAGDVILKFNDIEIETYRDLPKIVAETDVGTVVIVEVWSKNKTKNITVKLGELDEPIHVTKNNTESDSKNLEIIGVKVRNLVDSDYSKYNLDPAIKGVLVLDVDNQNTDLNINDVIVEVNRNKISNFEEFEKFVLEFKGTGRSSILLMVIRDKKTTWVTIKYL